MCTRPKQRNNPLIPDTGPKPSCGSIFIDVAVVSRRGRPRTRRRARTGTQAEAVVFKVLPTSIFLERRNRTGSAHSRSVKLKQKKRHYERSSSDAPHWRADARRAWARRRTSRARRHAEGRGRAHVNCDRSSFVLWHVVCPKLGYALREASHLTRVWPGIINRHFALLSQESDCRPSAFSEAPKQKSCSSCLGSNSARLAIPCTVGAKSQLNQLFLDFS